MERNCTINGEETDRKNGDGGILQMGFLPAVLVDMRLAGGRLEGKGDLMPSNGSSAKD